MTVADPRFTAEAITPAGKVIVFDDIGCLASWLTESETTIRGAWVASFVAPGDWLLADSAAYLAPPSLRTPMSSGLIALRVGAEADSVRASLGGTLYSWGEVRVRPHDHPVAH